MNKKQHKAINQLKKLAMSWPEGISLFSATGNLYIIANDGEILEQIYIPNDGRDPGSSKTKNGKEYFLMPE